MTRWMLVLVVAPTVLLMGCGVAIYRNAGSDQTEGYYGELEEEVNQPSRREVATKAPPEKALDRTLMAGEVGGEPVPAIPRMIIYTGRFTVGVYDVKQAQQALVDFVAEKGGHMQQTTANTLVLRIPSEHFALVEPMLRKLGRVDDRLTDIRTRDITAEYHDLELRLKTKREYLVSLRKLLDEAGKLKEKLAVQQEIARVVEEIESMEGRRRLLGSQVAMATVTVTFRLAHSGSRRTFRLPWEWLDELGLETLIR